MALIVLLTIVLILCIAGVKALIIVIQNAPVGWENKNGFHLGKQEYFDFKSVGKTRIKINEPK